MKHPRPPHSPAPSQAPSRSVVIGVAGVVVSLGVDFSLGCDSGRDVVSVGAPVPLPVGAAGVAGTVVCGSVGDCEESSGRGSPCG